MTMPDLGKIRAIFSEFDRNLSDIQNDPTLLSGQNKRRDVAYLQLSATIGFLSDLGFSSRLDGLQDLLVQLKSLDEGAVGPMLTPEDGWAGSTKTAYQRTPIVALCVAMNCLIQSGKSATAASKEIAKGLPSASCFRQNTPPSARTLRDWHARISKDAPLRSSNLHHRDVLFFNREIRNLAPIGNCWKSEGLARKKKVIELLKARYPE